MDNFSFTSFLSKSADTGQLLTIDHEMTGYELAALASSESRGVLYTRSSIPVAFNLFKTEKMIELALGMPIAEAAERAKTFDAGQDLTFTEPSAYTDISQNELPIFKHYAGDVSGSINMGCVISRDGDTHNCGIYRIQPLDCGKAVMHCYPASGLARQLSKGSDVPVTVAVGTSPHLIFTAAASLPEGTDELKLAAHLHPETLRYIRTENHPVPAGTQIIIQGRVSASEKYPEGPFMIYTGEYSEVTDYPALYIDSVKIAVNAVYHTLITGRAPMESASLLNAVSKII